MSAVVYVCMFLCVCISETSCCVCNLLFVHDSKHLRPLQNGGDTESGREVELDKKRLREGEKRIEGEGNGKTG